MLEKTNIEETKKIIKNEIKDERQKIKKKNVDYLELRKLDTLSKYEEILRKLKN